MNFIYTGPSWAASSFPEGVSATNLARQWDIPHINFALSASNVLRCIEKVKSHTLLPVVWIYHEPLGCLTEATGLSYTELLRRSDWKDIREDCNQFCLQQIANLNRPVLLIGGHSDIINCEHSNIVVGHKSWQKFLAEKAQMHVDNDQIYVKMDDGGNFSFKNCWGAEVMHRIMHENPDIDPSAEITGAVWDIFFFWKELEKANLFYDVHPNLQGNKLFAAETKQTVINFLEDIK